MSTIEGFHCSTVHLALAGRGHSVNKPAVNCRFFERGQYDSMPLTLATHVQGLHEGYCHFLGCGRIQFTPNLHLFFVQKLERENDQFGPALLLSAPPLPSPPLPSPLPVQSVAWGLVP